MLALVSSRTHAGHDADEPVLRDALANVIGPDRVAVEHWDDDSVDWRRYGTVVIRSAWDYPHRVDDFRAWARRVGESSRLLNPAAAVQWNSDKRYLAELESDGSRVIPTGYVAPGEPVPSTTGQVVVKPTVGASADGARRCRPHEVDTHVAVLHGRGRTAMIQPYLASIADAGETSLCFLADATGELRLSHTVRRPAVLGGPSPVREHGDGAEEPVTAIVPTAAELDLAHGVLALPRVRRLGALAYARVDLVPGSDGPLLMELELIEPSLFLRHAEGSAARAAFAFTAAQ